MSRINFIEPNDERLSYVGRIDFSDALSPKFYYAGSSVTVSFKGTYIKARIKNRRIYNTQEIGSVVDGKQAKHTFGEDGAWEGEYLITLAQGLDCSEHEAVLFKRQDASHYFALLGFETDGELLKAKPKPARRMECFGDSVSAGAVVEATDNVGMNDPENNDGVYDNAWYSYSMITARNLGAQLHNTAQGGIAIFDDTGYFHAPDCVGMESVYDKLCYIPEGGYTPWDFAKYIPHVVLFAVGQNDQHNEGRPDSDISDPSYREKWKNGYKGIVNSLRGHYPKAVFILLLTVLCHDSEWDKAVEEIKNELGGESRGFYHFMFKRTGKATPGHPRIPEQYEMAEELTAFISSLDDKIWE